MTDTSNISTVWYIRGKHIGRDNGKSINMLYGNE